MAQPFPFLILAAAVAILPSASGLVLLFPPDTTLEGLEVSAGEELFITAPGDLTLAGPIRTAATQGAGKAGPNITIHAAGTLTLLQGTVVLASDGRDGASVSQEGIAVGGLGGDGGSIRLEASRIVSHGATVRAGDGGDGGAALAWGNPHAWAKGGDAGSAGSVHLVGTVEGLFLRDSAIGGDGGAARADGAPGPDCPGTHGVPEISRGQNATGLGHGGDANATATNAHCGPVDGEGGRGGDASAYGGNGGTTPDGNGGRGGNATAIAGRGGDGMDACFTTNEEADASGIGRAGNGGIGGNATAIGGNGGPGPLGTGGLGGSAYTRMEGGNGGNATPPIDYGTGGASNGGGSHVKGGDGGLGVDGGGGGAAVAEGTSGSGGSLCGPLPSNNNLDVPLPGAVVLLALGGVAFARRRSR